MNAKRAMGALEDEIMAYLWTIDAPTTPGEVHAAIAPDLAYTTVMTVLTRLWDKGILGRQPKGRGYAYSPVRSEADHRAGQMRSTLDASDDRNAVLSSFVQALTPRDLTRLRTLIAEQDP